jgi:hypothetical protein
MVWLLAGRLPAALRPMAATLRHWAATQMAWLRDD